MRQSSILQSADHFTLRVTPQCVDPEAVMGSSGTGLLHPCRVRKNRRSWGDHIAPALSLRGSVADAAIQSRGDAVRPHRIKKLSLPVIAFLCSYFTWGRAASGWDEIVVEHLEW